MSKPKPKLKLFWINRETGKKTHTPIRPEVWFNIPFFKIMFDDPDIDYGEVVEVQLAGTFLNQVIHCYLSWCMNIDLADEFYNVLTCSSIYELYNLMELCKYLGDEHKLAVIPIPVPDNDQKTLGAIKNLGPGLRTKILTTYLSTTVSAAMDEFKYSRPPTPYQLLWFCMGQKPLIAEFLFEIDPDLFFSTVNIPNKEMNHFKNKTFNQVLNYLLLFDDFVIQMRSYRHGNFDFTLQKITDEIYDAAIKRTEAHKQLDQLYNTYDKMKNLLQSLKLKSTSIHSDGVEFSSDIKETTKQLLKAKKNYETYANMVLSNKILPKESVINLS
jgi:hypothetical protein